MFRRLIVLLAVLGVFVTGYSYWLAVQDPVMRTARIATAEWPAGQAPVRILLISDLHVAGPDMPPRRLREIVQQLNEAEADIILIAGDFVSDKTVATSQFSAREAVAPLASLSAPMGVFAVLGNHEYWRGAEAFRSALGEVDVTLLENDSVEAGPFKLIGIDDAVTDHDDMARAFERADSHEGIEIVLSHTPDIVPGLPRRVALVAAGHTHCGQIRLPLVGRITTASRYGERFACGMMDDKGQRVLVGAGLGTSILPLRFGVPPDFWLVEFGPDA